MKISLVLLAAVVLTLAACQNPPSSKSDAEFHAVTEDFLRGYLAWRPHLGVALGLHEHDGRITDYRSDSIARELQRLKEFDRKFASLNTNALSKRAYYDYRIVRAEIHRELFRFEDQKVFTDNPMTYAQAVDLNIYIKRDFAPLKERMKSIIAIEREVPRVLDAARQNLKRDLAKPFVETAIDQAKGVVDFLRRDLTDALKDVKDAEFEKVNQAAIAEFEKYTAWLEKERLPTAHGRYALGRDVFYKMVREGELIQLTPEQILEKGLKELKREQAIFAETARKLDPAKPAIEVFKAIQKDHPTEQNLIPDTKKNLEAIRKFCEDRKIITFPSPVRARVEETPTYLRATSFASMDTPGPFERKATEAYYYVTPTEKDWPAQQKEEWLTAFNYYTTDVVSIHEAYPGHYTQFLCLNASPANKVEKIIGSYAFVEGWAHYTEQMLLDEGFGADNLKYRLAQSDEALLRLCRLCVAIKTHCEGMSLDDATKFFQDNCYYEEKPARQEATRGTYDPGYLYYTLGKLQILKLRDDYQKQEGSRFSMQRFHDELLRHGMPPIRLLREVMLKDGSEWDEVF
jgi:uncharacterized protein (DUF885 family)